MSSSILSLASCPRLLQAVKEDSLSLELQKDGVGSPGLGVQMSRSSMPLISSSSLVLSSASWRIPSSTSTSRTWLKSVAGAAWCCQKQLQLLQWSQSLQQPHPQECCLGLLHLLIPWMPRGSTLLEATPVLLAAPA